MRAISVLAAALVPVIFAGCSLAIEVDDIDRGCGLGRKLCGEGNCVRIDDPAYGCTPTSCQPCLVENAVPVCREQDCAVGACLDGFGCPTDLGCGVNVLINRLNCGACNASCDLGQSCRNGQCVGE